MPRAAKPWFYKQTGWWMAWMGGRKVKLVKGPKNRHTLKQATERLEDLRVLARHNPPPDESSAQTVLSVIERYNEVELPTLSPATRTLRTSYTQSFSEAHGFRSVADARTDHLQEWLNQHPEWPSDWTKRDAVMAIRVVFNWAHKSKIIEVNPFAGFTHRAGSPRRDVTPREFQAMLRASGQLNASWWKKFTPGARFRQVLIFLHFTGCRPSEAADLRWANVDFEKQVIVLKAHKTIRMQRDPRPRVVPLHPVAFRLLEVLRRREEGDHVFFTHRKTPWTKDSLGHRLRKAREAEGLSEDVKIYGIRHAFGTRGVLNGCQLKMLAEVMGHTNTKTTEIYTHLAGKREELAAAMLTINQRPAPSKRPESSRRPAS